MLLKKILKACRVLKIEYFFINFLGKTILIKTTWSLSVPKTLGPRHLQADLKTFRASQCLLGYRH